MRKAIITKSGIVSLVEGPGAANTHIDITKKDGSVEPVVEVKTGISPQEWKKLQKEQQRQVILKKG